MGEDTQHEFLVQYGTSTGVSLGLERESIFSRLADHPNLHPQSSQLDWLLSTAPDAPRAAHLLGWLQANTRDVVDRSSLSFLSPVGSQEIWGAGVTYKRSEEAREAESNNSTIYTRVYNAARPELFFKAMGYDVVASGQPVGIRYDATWSVPEPELVVVLNAHMEVVGFTIGNDMSSRDIEGENPLYLPQAKVYRDACAIGPRIWLQPGATTWPDVKIELQIERGGQMVFSGQTSTSSIHRPLTELIDYLGRCKRFPWGVVLFTGTGIVPPGTFTLVQGDVVHIRVEPMGELVNTVHVVGQAQEKVGTA